MPHRKDTRDYHYANARHRLHPTLGASLLACITGVVHTGFQMKLLPALQTIEHGTEPMVNGQPLWDCNKSAEECYRAILQFLGMYMLMRSCFQGRDSDLVAHGIEQFERPQTSGSARNLEDKLCHMPAKEAFEDGICSKHTGNRYWYTKVRLGRTKEGKIVKVCAHVLIAAARYGVPDCHFDKDIPRHKRLQALHLFDCPDKKGGCNNPLHMRWGTCKENALDRFLHSLHLRKQRAKRKKSLKEPTRHVLAVHESTRVPRSQARARK